MSDQPRTPEEQQHATTCQAFLDAVNGFIGGAGVEASIVTSAMFTVAIGLMIHADGARDVSRQLYVLATSLCGHADAQESGAAEADALLTQLGIKLH